MKILGIDPGYGRIGIALLNTDKKESTVLRSECYVTDMKLPLNERMKKIADHCESYIQEKPSVCALERVFFSKNKKTAMAVTEICGVIRYLMTIHTIPVVEYTPNEIKQIVTNDGAADKKQMEKMVHILMPSLKKTERIDDEYDAIAVALAYMLAPRSDGSRGIIE